MKILDTIRSVFKAPVMEKTLLCFTRGQYYYESNVCKLAPNHYQYKKPSMREVIRKGIQYELDISDLIDWYLYFGFEDHSHRVLESYAEEKMVVIDVGANIGDTTLPLAKKVGPNGFVYGFEPDPTNFNKLEKNVSLNTFNNVKIERMALSSRGGSAEMEVLDPSNRGMNRIAPGSPCGKESETISMMALDDYVKSIEHKRVDLIKIDVEGHELEVLKGGKNLIAQSKPILHIEVSDNALRENRASASDVMQFLDEQAYDMQEIGNPMKCISGADDYTGKIFEILATPSVWKPSVHS